MANARNQALDRINFDEGYVSFIDADDYIHPTYFSYLYNLIKKYDADFSWCGVHNTFEKSDMEFADIDREYNVYTTTGKNLLLIQNIHTMKMVVQHLR